jgi:GNAT superfamily N-acetyltransferase
VKSVRWPTGFRLETLRRAHRRKSFCSGEPKVDDWLTTKALQNQTKRLSVTKVLLDKSGDVAGYYTLAPTQVDFSELPVEVIRHLPHRLLPAAVLAWLGISEVNRGRGLGGKLLAQALRDCWEGGRVFPFVLVMVDCVDEQAKSFFRKHGFAEFPGRPYRLYLRASNLDAMMQHLRGS